MISNLKDQTKKFLVSSFLETRDLFSLPESITQKIARSYFQNLENFAANYFNIFKSFLQSDNLLPQIEGLENIDLSNFFELNSTIFNESNLKKTLKESYNFVEPTEVSFSGTNEKLYYVPIRSTLKALCRSNNNLIESFLNHKEDSLFFKSGHYNNYIQHLSERGIYIKLYSDEFEVCNPVGVARSTHKLVVTYFSILNFPEYESSNLKNIYLLSIAKQKLYRSHYNECFKSLVDELNELFFEEIEISGYKFPVILSAFCGDNLSIHELLGLSTCFSSGYICRLCNIQFNQLSVPSCPDIQFRKHEDYVKDYINFSNSVKRKCPLLDIVYVDFPLFFPFDLMHDLLEGSSHVVVAIVIRFIICEKITLLELNAILASFNFGFSMCNITQNHLNKMKFPIKAADMLKLLCYLPLILGNIVEKEIMEWELLLLHIQILSSCLYPDSDFCQYDFEAAVFRHNEIIYEATLGSPKSKCKLHYLTHYSSLINYYKSMHLYWNMRFEGMHQYFKSLVRKTKQFKNIAFTCSIRYQMRQAVLLNSNKEKDNSPITMQLDSSTVGCYLVLEEIQAIEREIAINIQTSEILFSSSSLVVNNLHFKIPTEERAFAIIIENDGPQIMMLEKIVHIQNTWIILGRQLNLIYHPHFNCYSVTNKEVYPTALVCNKIKRHPVPVHTIRCLQCICLPLQSFK